MHGFQLGKFREKTTSVYSLDLSVCVCVCVRVCVRVCVKQTNKKYSDKILCKFSEFTYGLVQALNFSIYIDLHIPKILLGKKPKPKPNPNIYIYIYIDILSAILDIV